VTCVPDEWFVTNVADARWVERPGFGKRAELEPEGESFPLLGIRVSVLQPGDRSTYYHAEHGEQEGFLVLDGSCLAIVEEQEVPLRRLDYLHCPSGTRHVLVNDSNAPCSVLMIGTRHPESWEIVYPVSELALKHEAGVREEAHSPRDAYAGLPPWEPTEPAEL
jgi:uncharacterized cupin superfamily protein